MSKAKRTGVRESDNTYFLKLLMFLALGLIWVKINGYVILPIGLILGIILAQHDHFSIDRKVEYAVLIVSAAFGLAGFGAYLGFWFS